MRDTLPNRRVSSRRNHRRTWWRASLLTACAPLALAFGACAEPAGIDVPEGEFIEGQPEPVGASGVCGEGTLFCEGAGINGAAACCPAGTNCVDQACVPAESCQTNADCDSDQVCGGRLCRSWSFLGAQPWDQSCRTNVDLPSLRPVAKCHWPQGTPAEFPESV